MSVASDEATSSWLSRAGSGISPLLRWSTAGSGGCSTGGAVNGATGQTGSTMLVDNGFKAAGFCCGDGFDRFGMGGALEGGSISAGDAAAFGVADAASGNTSDSTK